MFKINLLFQGMKLEEKVDRTVIRTVVPAEIQRTELDITVSG